VIIDWITIRFGRKPSKGGSPSRDASDVNIMNFNSSASLLVIKVWWRKDTPDSLIAVTTAIKVWWRKDTPDSLIAVTTAIKVWLIKVTPDS
jgi:hypothetical protein